VSRCNEEEKPDAKGDFWKCIELSPADLEHEDTVIGASASAS